MPGRGENISEKKEMTMLEILNLEAIRMFSPIF